MKKIEFALQVFGFITIFPLYIIMGLNQATAKPASNNIPEGAIQKKEKVISNIPANTFAGPENQYPVTIILKSFL